ncbi:MAG TPA: signal peptidase I [Pyrinomonadaceae bacterium]
MKSTTLLVIILAAFSFGCNFELKETVVFQGTSMLPGIRDGDRLTVERFGEGEKLSLNRGEVIAFWYPDDPSKSYIKRLIGLPGETVEIREGAVFINGNKLEEPYVEAQRNLSKASKPPEQVKAHYYYVLGDNRDASSDSRYWGLVPEKYIYAKVIPR